MVGTWLSPAEGREQCYLAPMRFLLLLCLPACRDALIDSPEAEETGESGDTQDTYDTGEPVDTGDPLKVYDLAFPALVSDGGNERFMAMDLANGDVYWTYDMRLEEPELCQPEEAWECGAYGAIHQVDALTGEDLFTFTWHRMSVDSPTDIGSRHNSRTTDEVDRNIVLRRYHPTVRSRYHKHS